MRNILNSVDRNKIPRPPTWTPAERQELEQWKAWIDWEKSNPLLLDDANALYTRVIYAYKQAMMNMRFYPELWYLILIVKLIQGTLQQNTPRAKAENRKRSSL